MGDIWENFGYHLQDRLMMSNQIICYKYSTKTITKLNL